VKRILIVDDEPSIRKVLAAHLKKFGYDVETAEDGPAAVARLEAELFHLVVSDLRMPGMDGMALLAWVLERCPGLPVILITAHGTVDTAVEAIKRGAFDYVTKPFDKDELQAVIAKALSVEEATSARATGAPDAGGDLVGQTPSMRDLVRLIARVGPSPTTVLLTGESGTGKQRVARALHDASDRRTASCLTVHCSAIPEALFEAELFGIERGPVTGGATSKPGRFELAHGGTLFLDEVDALPLTVQARLLRALQERQVDRVGGARSVSVDVRVIAATDIDLKLACEQGRFRQDLYYLLHVIPIALPPLRERKDDLPLLVEHFLRTFNRRLGKAVQRVDPDALAALLAHPWPGNVRELENLMERLVLLADGDTIRQADLPALRRAPPEAGAVGLDLKEYIRVHTARLERARIQEVLDAEAHNVTRAARALGISRKSLQTKMKDYGLRDLD